MAARAGRATARRVVALACARYALIFWIQVRAPAHFTPPVPHLPVPHLQHSRRRHSCLLCKPSLCSVARTLHRPAVPAGEDSSDETGTSVGTCPICFDPVLRAEVATTQSRYPTRSKASASVDCVSIPVAYPCVAECCGAAYHLKCLDMYDQKKFKGQALVCPSCRDGRLGRQIRAAKRDLAC